MTYNDGNNYQEGSITVKASLHVGSLVHFSGRCLDKPPERFEGRIVTLRQDNAEIVTTSGKRFYIVPFRHIEGAV